MPRGFSFAVFVSDVVVAVVAGSVVWVALVWG